MSPSYRAASAAITVAAAAATLSLPALAAPDDTQIIGNVRVEAFSPSLVRIEVKGPEGFEDRPTFHIVQRYWDGLTMNKRESGGFVTLSTRYWIIRIPSEATSLAGVTIVDNGGKILYSGSDKVGNAAWLPEPADQAAAWAIADTPRMVPPSWGATPAPAGNKSHPATSGWDTGNDAPDVYVFLPPDGDYIRLRKDYLRLTGPTELPPLYMFGLFHSRYQPYSEADARGIIATYRQKQIPLDVMVLDTDWRIGASVGYAANTQLFSDLGGYLKDVHKLGIRTMFNDHPEPKSPGALDPKELQFRYDGLSQWLNQGLDLWWYDRNWGISLNSPMPGLRHEVWGMQVYHDMTQKAAPNRRPVIMSNVDGIDNGIRNRPSDMAAHRFPIQWTGDTTARWIYLQYGVENAVYSGVHSLVPYMSEDLGGHNGGKPSTELYVRFMEYGTLSPTTRPHSTRAKDGRAPWEYGTEAEKIVGDYIRMRYRLMPYLYTTARANYDNGDPMLRRLDLEFPTFPEAAANDQYLLGSSLLVAPIIHGADESKPVPTTWLIPTRATSKQPHGLTASYFDNDSLTGTPVLTRNDDQIDFNWDSGSPDPKVPNDHFSCRWEGRITNQLGTPVTLQATSDDGIRVFLDGKPVIDAWGPSDGGEPFIANAPLEPGRTYNIRVEYQELEGGALCHLGYKAESTGPVISKRDVWIPPGAWTNIWNGETQVGPKTVSVTVPISQTPMFVRAGAMIPLVPQMQYTDERPWDAMVLDTFPVAGTDSATDLYEDDTQTNDYKKGVFRTTHIESTSDLRAQKVRVKIAPAKGKSFANAVKNRQWTLRIHKPGGFAEGETVASVQLDGKTLTGWTTAPRNTAPDAMPFVAEGSSPDCDVLQIPLPRHSVGKGHEVVVTYSAGK